MRPRNMGSIGLNGKIGGPGGGGAGGYSMSLSGKSANITTTEDPKLKEIRTQLMERFLFPLMRRDMTDVFHNFYLLSSIKSIISSLKERNPDVEYYENLIAFIEDSYNVYKSLHKIYETDPESKKGFGNFVVRTATISIKPQYHLYNLIIGKPAKGTPYNQQIIDYIIYLLTRVNLTYKEIHSLVRRRFGLPEVEP